MGLDFLNPPRPAPPHPRPAPPRGAGLKSYPIPAPPPLQGGKNPCKAKRGGAS